MNQSNAQYGPAGLNASNAPALHSLAAQESKARLESGIRIFTILSWTGGLFGLTVFIFALLTGVPFDGAFLLVAGLMTAYVLLPLVLRLTKRLDLITVIGMLWLVLCMGAGAWNYGGYASAALPWLCAIPILSFYYLRGTKLVLVLLALGLCLVLVSVRHLATQTLPPQMDAVYGISFAFLLLFLSLASYVFRSAENEARQNMIRAVTDAREAREKAEIANAAKSKFLASVSHELRTPLNAIVGFSDFLRQKATAVGVETKIPEYAADIHFSATHLLALINDVLDYSEVGTEHAQIAHTPVDLRGVIDEALTLITFQPGAGDLHIDHNITVDVPLLLGDERRLKQVAVNLLVNAIKFTAKGGRVKVSLERAGDGGIGLIVTDTGIGIAPEDMPNVLQPFFKAANIDVPESPGIGLGLSITAELVKLHDGALSIESEVGVGTTVTCRFPASRVVTSS